MQNWFTGRANESVIQAVDLGVAMRLTRRHLESLVELDITNS